MNDKNKYWLFMVILIASIIPFIINEVYKVEGGYITSWGASDVLIFYSGFLSFTGALALGALALHQNNRLMKLEEKRFRLELQPFVTITDWKVETDNISLKILNPLKTTFQIDNNNELESIAFLLSFTNTSNTFSMVNYVGAKVYGRQGLIESWSVSSTNQQNPKLSLHIGDAGEIIFICSKEKFISFQGKKIVLELVLENKINERYKETIDIMFAAINEETWTIYLSPQNYTIMKF